MFDLTDFIKQKEEELEQIKWFKSNLDFKYLEDLLSIVLTKNVKDFNDNDLEVFKSYCKKIELIEKFLSENLKVSHSEAYEINEREDRERFGILIPDILLNRTDDETYVQNKNNTYLVYKRNERLKEIVVFQNVCKKFGKYTVSINKEDIKITNKDLNYSFVFGGGKSNNPSFNITTKDYTFKYIFENFRTFIDKKKIRDRGFDVSTSYFGCSGLKILGQNIEIIEYKEQDRIYYLAFIEKDLNIYNKKEILKCLNLALNGFRRKVELIYTKPINQEDAKINLHINNRQRFLSSKIKSINKKTMEDLLNAHGMNIITIKNNFAVIEGGNTLENKTNIKEGLELIIGS
ncbi:MAG: hypothetical protein CL760_05460 [Chloroflexi bacterium]|nr:hypothetical protein [Chloroflexota bacterium]|tara:strand:+ start:44966 stop:46006 length:1041 start_codon:yes stop_codon:yes gene_type:complete